MSTVNVRCYTRVSTEEQALSGYSLPAQRERLESYVVAYPTWRIVDWYVDDGISAKSLNRVQMKRMIADLCRGDVLLVYKLDRLTRRVVDLEWLVEFMDKNGVSLRSVNENIDTSTANGRLFLRLIIEVAQWERETASERTSMGMKQKIASGEWRGGPTLFGYIAVPNGRTKRNGKAMSSLVPDESTAHLVPDIFRRYLAGQGVRAIAKWLNEEVVVKTSRNARWRSNAVIRILTNPFFTGKSVIRHDDGTLSEYPGEHEALVDRETFETVQTIFHARKLVAPRQSTGKYVLTGVARCGVCGGPVEINRYKRDSYTYRCRNYAVGRGCGDRALTSFVGNVAEAMVFEAIHDLLAGQNIAEFVAEFERDAMKRTGASSSEVDRINVDLRDVEKRIARWDDAYETGELAWDKYRAKVDPMENEKASLLLRLNEISAVVSDIPDVEGLREAAMLLTEAWVDATQPMRKALLLSFVTSFKTLILLYPDQVVRLRPAT